MYDLLCRNTFSSPYIIVSDRDFFTTAISVSLYAIRYRSPLTGLEPESPTMVLGVLSCAYDHIYTIGVSFSLALLFVSSSETIVLALQG